MFSSYDDDFFSFFLLKSVTSLASVMDKFIAPRLLLHIFIGFVRYFQWYMPDLFAAYCSNSYLKWQGILNWFITAG